MGGEQHGKGRGTAWEQHGNGMVCVNPPLRSSQKALGTLPEDGNVMPKLVGATIHN
jgi:hypothetical protein